MGPYSEDKQMERAESIKRLLDHNPQLDRLYRVMSLLSVSVHYSALGIPSGSHG